MDLKVGAALTSRLDFRSQLIPRLFSLGLAWDWEPRMCNKLFSFFNLLNPWYWNAWAIVFILDGIGGILGVIASSVLICCGGEGIKTQQAKASAASKHKCAMGCGIGAAVCFGAYVIAMVVAMVQLSQCEGSVEEICNGVMWLPAIGMILGLLCVASAVVAAVFAGRAASAIETFNPDAVPQAPVVAVATAVATPVS